MKDLINAINVINKYNKMDFYDFFTLINSKSKIKIPRTEALNWKFTGLNNVAFWKEIKRNKEEKK
jgi:Ca2+-binding EF-hand superfamily protein